MKKEEAEKLGAEHEFGATYPDTVSVYSVGALDDAFSIEFCGGGAFVHAYALGRYAQGISIVKALAQGIAPKVRAAHFARYQQLRAQLAAMPRKEPK